MEINKLELKTKTISVLSNSDLSQLNGAEGDALTTSFGDCTGFLCCGSDSKWERAVASVLLMSVAYTIFG
ncbi:hypothetical protein [Pedobacter sandarakinus]|uniref:hypothetical protein n=1 Tax=Pedobacter sandarakinus TaxID=353156 RepID=UPI002246519A|nr:hypothetical protein [Pedobacter sandarakinus]MCX2576125.1 hypothetical protein [Pedobacter sandarakinus]